MNRAAVASELQALTTQAEREFGLEAFDVSLAWDGYLALYMLRVPKSAHSAGHGTEAMERLTRFADTHGLRIALNLATRGDGYGTTSRTRLVRFYKRFGFRENTGPKRDLTMSYQMLREPRIAAARRGNPVAPTHHHIWSCPSGPENIVFFLQDHYETESEERILRAGGGWRKVAGDMYFAGGWQTKREFVKDWAVNWYRVKNPDGGLPIYVIAASHVENVFAPEGVDADDLARWAQAWEDAQ